jgi:hypothetical protein
MEQRLGHHQITERLGAGGMGEALRAGLNNHEGSIPLVRVSGSKLSLSLSLSLSAKTSAIELS